MEYDDMRQVLRHGREMALRRKRRREKLAEPSPADSTEPTSATWKPARVASRRRVGLPVAALIVAAVTLFLAGPITLLISEDERAALGLLGTFTLACGFGALAAMVAYRRQKRRVSWYRTMFNWQGARQDAAQGLGKFRDSAQDIATHEALSEFERGRPDRATALVFRSVRALTPSALQEFAANVYERMGYEVRLVGPAEEFGVDIRLVNPFGKAEIVKCIPDGAVADEMDVCSLFGVLHHLKAARAYLWAPAGFTPQAQRWAKGKPLVLADEWEIERLVEAAYRAHDGVGRG